MEKTPSRSRFSHRRLNIPTGTSTIYEPGLEENIFIENTETSDSPVHIACTQEGFNDVDVIWDWNSPQPKPQAKSKKKILSMQSPKIPLMRHSSNNEIQNFEKFREDMQSLKESVKEDRIVSPLQEDDYKDIKHTENMDTPYMPLHENYPAHEDDLFNDSADEHLALCSQKVETELKESETKKNLFCNNNDRLANVKDTDNKLTPLRRDCDLDSINLKNFSNIENVNNNIHIGNDSFDAILKEFKGDSNESFTVVRERINSKESTTKRHTFSRTKSENQNGILKPAMTGKMEFHRTVSFESTVEHMKERIPQSKLEEIIERNRREAIARLEAKRKYESSDSPIKCTPQQIEQKRLQALAKREAKRQQEIIEHKRQEALKRLEQSRKKNATIVKSSLCKRL